MSQTTARIKRGGKNFEVLVDLDEALKVRRGEPSANINAAVLTEYIFYNLKSGEHASTSDLQEHFGTEDVTAIGETIIKSGEVVRTAESMRVANEQKYKQVVDFLSRSAVSPEGRPYTPDRIMRALSEAHVNVKNKPIETQIGEIMDQLRKVLPMSIETKKAKLIIPAQHTGKAYGILKEYIVSETWLGNGNLEAVVEMPAALAIEFYDRLNSATHGSVMSEDIRD